MGQGQLQGGLLWSYLGHGALVGPCDLESSLHNPAFMEYTSRVFGDVTVVVRDCPSWVRDVCRNRLRKAERWPEELLQYESVLGFVLLSHVPISQFT